MSWRSIERDRAAVTRAIRRGDEAIARGQWQRALQYYRKANPIAVRVAAAGESDQDRAVLGSIYYNLAELNVKDGEVAMAWLCVLQACRVYEPLDPSAGDPARVAACVAAGAAGGRVEERIAQAADAHSRYVLLSAGLVREHGPRALEADVGGGALAGVTDPAAVIERFGPSAIQTVRELVRHGGRYTHDDLARTEARIAQARSIIGG